MNRERFEYEKNNPRELITEEVNDSSKQSLDSTEDEDNGKANDIGKDGQPKDDKAGYQKQTMDEEK